MKRVLMSLSSVLMLVAASQAQPVERPERRVSRPEIPVTLNLQYQQPDSIVLKFVDSVAVRLVDGELQANGLGAAADLAPYRQVLASTTQERLFSRPVSDLDLDRTRALRRVPQHQSLPADLNNYYRIRTSGVAQTEALLNQLLSLPLVETAYPEPSRDAITMAGGVDVDPPTGLFHAEQTFQAAGPTGHGWDPVYNIAGVLGFDLTVAQLEGSWFFGHEDECDMTTTNVVGAQPSSSWDSWKDHGTACVGIMTGDRNGFGIRGLANQAETRMGGFDNASTADGINLMAAALQPGDVMESSWVWNVSFQHAPLDFFQAEWDAVQAATLAGVNYFYSAGNTNSDLDDQSIFGDRYIVGAPDNGGVIVGASNSANTNKIGFSSFGSRVDCNAWGENIPTLGYGDRFLAGSEQSYTSFFGGTSGAAPICAGVAACLINAVLHQNNQLLTPFEVRELMRTVGTPQGLGGNIGPRANLEMLLAEFGLPDGLNLQGDGGLGQISTLNVRGMPSTPFIVYVSLDHGKVPNGLNRDWLFDFTTFVPVSGFVYDGAGEADLPIDFPNDPIFADTILVFQVLDRDGPGSLHLTNSVELWIRP